MLSGEQHFERTNRWPDMSTYNKAKGSKFEVDVMKYIRKLGHFAERLAKAGASDEGDIVSIIAGQTYILECKNRKKIDLPAFWKEAQKESENYAKARGLVVAPPAFVVVKRRNASIEDAWVIQPLGEWLDARTTRTDNDKRDMAKPSTSQGRDED